MNLEETGGFASSALIAEAQTLTLDTLTLREAVAIGQFTTELADIKKLPVSRFSEKIEELDTQL